jgi:hypothetical protein
VFYSLYEALRRPQLPGWATGLIAQATRGGLEQQLQQAIATLQVRQPTIGTSI